MTEKGTIKLTYTKGRLWTSKISSFAGNPVYVVSMIWFHILIFWYFFKKFLNLHSQVFFKQISIYLTIFNENLKNSNKVLQSQLWKRKKNYLEIEWSDCKCNFMRPSIQKIAMPSSQQYPEKFCLIKYELDINIENLEA